MTTEAISGRYRDLDLWPTVDAVRAMAEGQLAAAAAVQPAIEAIAGAADMAAASLAAGEGRIAYAGAGTSGRVAVQDGTELGPTFDWPEDRLCYFLAGGKDALWKSAEDAEDDAGAAIRVMGEQGIGAGDVLIGVAASGTTPFTNAAVEEARRRGALTVGLACNAGAPLLDIAERGILIETGSEIVAGSTRMKAGTAQKIALNLFSTAVMIRLGRVHAGLMVNMRLSNRKLRVRAAAMVADLASCDMATAEAALRSAGDDIKTAVLVAMGADPAAAKANLKDHEDSLRRAMAVMDSRTR